MNHILLNGEPLLSISGESLISSVSVTIGCGQKLTWHTAHVLIPASSAGPPLKPWESPLSQEVRQLFANHSPEPVEALSIAAYRIRRLILAQEEWLKEVLPSMNRAGYTLEDLCLANFYVEGVVALVPKEHETLLLRDVVGHWPLFDGSNYLVSNLNADWRDFARFDVAGKI